MMMSIGIFVGRDLIQHKNHEWFTQSIIDALLKLDPNLDIQVWPNIPQPEKITFALAWLHPFDVLNHLPQLKAISSLGAGVDHLLADPTLPVDLTIVRVVDPYMASDIVQYVVSCVLNHVKRMDHWRAKQAEHKWSKEPPFNLSDKTIGIMGVGHLGKKAIHAFLELNLKVIGFSQSVKTIAGSQQYVGDDQFDSFLNHTDILVCMLPLTKKTEGILNERTFATLKDDAYIINVGRGLHLIEADLLTAIKKGKLSGAALDVFQQEPLPGDHPFWQQPKIKITPHIASVTNPETVAPQLLENYRRLLANEPLLHEMNRAKGY